MNTGDHLGRFRIVRKIGEGGMGEVFLAEDPKLGRQIAVKVLSADFAADSDRMVRFIHEAITASSLNHPNIITIYEINDEDHRPFIAMEFVEGETLGRRMKRLPLEIHETLDTAIQIATALAAAHEAGVVHRDVKPDNVILRPDGLVKVLDFGLAKQISGRTLNSFEDAFAAPDILTHPGLVMGTVAYMSPEQARGKVVDARSDIFSFGAMLYQMACGRLPFTGENDLDVVSSILHKEPRPLKQSARVIPHDVELVIRKSLRKNREERYQSMRELLADLKDIREDLRLASGERYRSNGSHASNGHGRAYDAARLSDAERGMPTERMAAAGDSTRELSMAPNTLSGILMSEIKAHPVKMLGASALLAAVFSALLFGAFRLAESWREPESFQTMRIEKLTFSGNVARAQAAVSPDGKYVAYVVEEGREQSLWVKQATSESTVQIVAPSADRFNGVTFSPSGERIYYSASDGTKQSIYTVATLGGPARRVIENGYGPLSFSPDGRSVLFIREETSLIASELDGSNARVVASAGDNERWTRASYSPDGSKVAAVFFSASESNDRLTLLDPATGTRDPIDELRWYRISGLAWTQDAHLLVSARDLELQYAQIWLVDPANATRKRVTNDLSSYQGVSLTADGRSLVSTQQNTLSNVWTIDPAAGGGQPAKITQEIGKGDGMSGVAMLPDGRVLYTARIKGTIDIWMINADGRGNKQLTFNAAENFSPAVSPDGRTIVFVSTREGDPSLWRMDADGNNPTRLTKLPGSEVAPVITPDGSSVVFQYVDPANVSTIMRVPLAGGEPAALVATESASPAVSPDGSALVCQLGTAESGNARMAVLSLKDGGEMRVLDFPRMLRSRHVRFSADGKALLYIDGTGERENLWSQPIAGGEPSRITDFPSDRIFRFDISYPSGHLVFARGSDTSDVVMLADFR